jgi:hypothetical protein
MSRTPGYATKTRLGLRLGPFVEVGEVTDQLVTADALSILSSIDYFIPQLGPLTDTFSRVSKITSSISGASASLRPALLGFADRIGRALQEYAPPIGSRCFAHH